MRPETVDRLRQLFISHKREDHQTFSRTAEAIIRELTAANQHDEARALQQALANGSLKDDVKLTRLEAMPRARLEKLIAFTDSNVPPDKVVLSGRAQRAIDRIILENREANRLSRSGFKPSQKLLFWGPPGCGKSLTACLLGHELGLPIGTVRLSAVITSYVGETAANINAVFDRAAQTPMVLLLDEVDAIAKARDDSNDVGELKRVVNSLLQILDSFRSERTIVVACSNHQYLLDPAVWRRFDDIVEFPLPTAKDVEIFTSRFLCGVNTLELDRLIPHLAGFSYAEVERVLVKAIKRKILDDLPTLPLTYVLNEAKDFKEERRRATKLKRRT